MSFNLPRLTLASFGAGLLLAGCAGHPARSRSGAAEAAQPQSTAETPAAPGTQADNSHGASRAAAHGGHAVPSGASGQTTRLHDNTGIPACDAYLTSYVACHRAAAIYKPDEIQGHYQAMRTSLLRDSQDPAVRPNLAARCNSLASQLRQALHGKSCETTPVTPTSGD